MISRMLWCHESRGVHVVEYRDGSDSYGQVVLAKGPVGYWRLGEAGGPTAFDSSGNGNDGTYYGHPSFGQPGAINNNPDTAVGFNRP